MLHSIAVSFLESPVFTRLRIEKNSSNMDEHDPAVICLEINDDERISEEKQSRF